MPPKNTNSKRRVLEDGKGGGKFDIFCEIRLGKEEIRNAVFDREFCGKNSISDISVRFTNFVVCTHLFLVNIASFFLVNAKISCQILWFAQRSTHTQSGPPLFLCLIGTKNKVFTFGKDSQGHLNQEPHATSCEGRLLPELGSGGTKCMQYDCDYPVSTPWKHILWCSAYWVEDDIRSFPLPSVSITPISDPTCPSFIVNEAMFDGFLF